MYYSDSRTSVPRKQQLSEEKVEYTVNKVQYTVLSVFKPESDERAEAFADKMKKLILSETIVTPKTKK